MDVVAGKRTQTRTRALTNVHKNVRVAPRSDVCVFVCRVCVRLGVMRSLFCVMLQVYLATHSKTPIPVMSYPETQFIRGAINHTHTHTQHHRVC